MKDCSQDGFPNVIINLKPSSPNIVPVPQKFTNSAGVYHSPVAQEGFQYAATFLTIDDKTGHVSIEIFNVKKDGTKMILDGSAGDEYIDKDSSDEEIKKKAVDMIENWLQPV